MPKIVDHDARRLEITEAFLRVIAREGIEGATTREIAREAGVSLGVLSHYFGSKEDLVLGAFNVMIRAFGRRVAQAIFSQTSARAALEAGTLAALPLDDARRLEAGLWLSFWAHGYRSAAARRRQQDEYETWVSTLAAVISAFPSKPDPQTARRAATGLAAFIDGLTVHLILRGPEALPPDEARDQLRSYIGKIG